MTSAPCSPAGAVGPASSDGSATRSQPFSLALAACSFSACLVSTPRRGAVSRLSGSRGAKDEGLKRHADEPSGWVAESGGDAGPAPSAEVTQLHTNGAGGDPARTPPTT